MVNQYREWILRSVSMVIMIVGFMAAVWAGGMCLVCAVAVLTLVAVYQWQHSTSTPARNHSDMVWLIAVVGFGLILAPGWQYDVLPPSGRAGIVGIVVFTCIIMFMLQRVTTKDSLRWSWGPAYIVVGAWFLVWIRAQPDGREIAMAMVIAITAYDIFALLGGKLLGKKFPRQIAPTVSEGKTVVGTIVGVFASAAVGCVVSPNLAGVISFAVVGILAFCGDLMMSKVKRDVGIKDFTGLVTIPGHGGVLDRFDSHLLVYWLVGAKLAITGTPFWVW